MQFFNFLFGQMNALNSSVDTLFVPEKLFDYQRDEIKWIFKERMIHNQFLLILFKTEARKLKTLVRDREFLSWHLFPP